MTEYNWKSDKPLERNGNLRPTCALCDMIIWNNYKIHYVRLYGQSKARKQTFHARCLAQVINGRRA